MHSKVKESLQADEDDEQPPADLPELGSPAGLLQNNWPRGPRDANTDQQERNENWNNTGADAS